MMTRWGDWEPEPPEVAVRDWGCGVRVIETAVDFGPLFRAMARGVKAVEDGLWNIYGRTFDELQPGYEVQVQVTEPDHDARWVSRAQVRYRLRCAMGLLPPIHLYGSLL